MPLLYVLIAVVVILIIWFIAAYNGFVVLRNKVQEAFSTMDVYLKKRYDLVPNLVETVKGYKDYEASTLEKVIQARNIAQAPAQSFADKQANENMLTSSLRSLFALAESYPDLKANTTFLNLQTQLESLEVDIAQARKYYNAIVKAFNTKTEVFPSNLVASMMGFKKYEFFTIEETEREVVQVKF